MKVRIKGNFVRYRLSKSEVEKISTTGSLEESTHFGGDHVFTYALISKEGISDLEADFVNSKLSVYIPTAHAASWFTNNKVGYKTTIRVDENITLDLLIEKDFQCLDEVVEDQSDNYPNPQA